MAIGETTSPSEGTTAAADTTVGTTGRDRTEGPTGGRGRSEGNGRSDRTRSAETERSRAEGRNLADDLKDQARETGERLTDAARDRAGTVFSEQQHMAAERLDGIAEALRASADRLQQQHQDMLSRYAGMAANQVEGFAERLRTRGFDDLLSRSERFARRQPELFVGGALLAGVALGRFLRASGERRRHGTVDDSGDRGSYAGGGTWGGYGGPVGETGDLDRRSRFADTTEAMGAGAGGYGTPAGGTGAGGLGDARTTARGTTTATPQASPSIVTPGGTQP